MTKLYHGALKFSDNNRTIWGEGVMGSYKNPKMSGEITLIAMLNLLDLVNTHPQPLYAIYWKEDDAWEVGYDSEIAVYIRFEKEGDIVRYEYFNDDFNSEYIHSKNNVLSIK